VSDIWQLKTGRRQNVAIDARRAAAALRSTNYMQRPGADGAFAPVENKNHEAMIKITQPWPTKDGRWFLPHFGLPNLQPVELVMQRRTHGLSEAAEQLAQYISRELSEAR